MSKKYVLPWGINKFTGTFLVKTFLFSVFLKGVPLCSLQTTCSMSSIDQVQVELFWLSFLPSISQFVHQFSLSNTTPLKRIFLVRLLYFILKVVLQKKNQDCRRLYNEFEWFFKSCTFCFRNRSENGFRQMFQYLFVLAHAASN